MAQIKGFDNKLELKLRRALWSNGVRYRLKFNLIGKPDIVIPKSKIAIFVDGDFWHGYQWSILKVKLKDEYWRTKILNNRKRDCKVNEALTRSGWSVIRFWEHQINEDVAYCVKIILSLIVS